MVIGRLGEVIVVVCPGQGSQTPGFLAPWLESGDSRDRLVQMSDDSGVDLVEHGTESDADTIRDTRIAQPLIVAASILAWNALIARLPEGIRPDGIAGHSVGELAALVGAGVLDTSTAMRLVGVRGRSMAHAASLHATGMSAILGGDEQLVLETLESLDLTPANYNGSGQIVAAGDLDALARLASEPPAKTRVVPLQVAGAFHTRFMEPAVDELRAAADSIETKDPAITLWTNRDGSVIESGTTAIDLLVGQVASPVRWDLCMQSFADRGVTGIIELAPAGTLVGLAKRALRGVPSVAVKTPDDLEAAVAMMTGEAA